MQGKTDAAAVFKGRGVNFPAGIQGLAQRRNVAAGYLGPQFQLGFFIQLNQPAVAGRAVALGHHHIGDAAVERCFNAGSLLVAFGLFQHRRGFVVARLQLQAPRGMVVYGLPALGNRQQLALLILQRPVQGGLGTGLGFRQLTGALHRLARQRKQRLLRCQRGFIRAQFDFVAFHKRLDLRQLRLPLQNFQVGVGVVHQDHLLTQAHGIAFEYLDLDDVRLHPGGQHAHIGGFHLTENSEFGGDRGLGHHLHRNQRRPVCRL